MATDHEGRQVIVCHNGSVNIKCGFCTSSFPDYSFPCMVGRPSIWSRTDVYNTEIQDIMVGDEAQNVRQMLKISYPVKNGIVNNWEDMIHIYNYLFGPKKMSLDTKNAKILLTEAPLVSEKNRAKMLEIMLEQFQFHECLVYSKSILPLYATGLLTGVVVDIDDGATYICPVIDGFCLRNSIARLNIAGRNVTRNLFRLLCCRGYVFNEYADFDTVQQIKEKLCYVAHDFEQERKLALDTTVLVEKYTLPDGRIIKLSGERFEAPEILFRPSLFGYKNDGVAEQVFKVINSAPTEDRRRLYRSIVLCGGTTMYPGFVTRLKCELEKIYKERILGGDSQKSAKNIVCVQALPLRRDMAFHGGTLYANLVKDTPTQWVSRKDYEELGIERCVQRFN